MNNYFRGLLSEEQMAAYLDGMLSTEESCYVEEQIMDEPALQEIQDSLDDVDVDLIAYDEAQELPLECISDDFQLPVIGYDNLLESESGVIETDEEPYSNSYDENGEDSYRDGQDDYDQDQAFNDSSFGDMSF